MSFSSLIFTLPALLLLFNNACAQLGTCIQVKCPQKGQDWSCPIGNVTNEALVIAGFDSSISPADNLTWTLGFSQKWRPASDDSSWTRQYYLGSPKTVSLQSSPSIGGCAMFFEGAMPKLRLEQENEEFSQGTCADVMGSTCVTDLLAQARDETLALSALSPVADQVVLCNHLAELLRISPPNSCGNITSGSWGKVVGRSKSQLLCCCPSQAHSLTTM